ncbi:MAG TPA: type IV pilin protein [Steroidobacteraceae bacterium]|nr:type IV pilin protein [Steroidobacteraceae bacterium]
MHRPAGLLARMRGVTLLELMIVVIILSILAAIAFPSYRSYVMRTNRTEATAALLNIASNQERFYLQNNTYATNAQLPTAPPNGLGIPTTTEGGRYTLSITAANAAGFTAQAVPATGGGQTADTACQAFTINAQGIRAATKGGGGDNTAECWR